MAELSLAPLVLNISGVRAGDANARTYTLLANGAPWDLTDVEVTAQARAKQTDPDPPALEATIRFLDAAAGSFIVAWDGDQVTALLAGSLSWTGVWDLQLRSDPDALPLTVVAGSFKAEQDVTRP